MKEPMIVKSVTYNSESLLGIIIDALDRELGGYYENSVMETYFPDFDDSNCETSLDVLIMLAEMGAKAVEEGRLTLNELLSRN